MTWAQKRKFTYISYLVIFLVIFVVIPTAVHFYKAPTCSDGKRNQDELGIDCGGSCALLCPAQYVDLNVLWSRFAKVSDGVYNVLAYIENPNLNAGAANSDYTFKIYDKKGILLDQRSGRTFAPANKVMAVFEAELRTGNQLPQRVEFDFTSRPIWLKQESRETGLSISQATLSRLDSAPRLSALLTNKTIKAIKKIEAIGVIYNEEGNTMAFSRTVVDEVPGKESKEINFNWPQSFTDTYARTEIVLKILN